MLSVRFDLSIQRGECGVFIFLFREVGVLSVGFNLSIWRGGCAGCGV